MSTPALQDVKVFYESPRHTIYNKFEAELDALMEKFGLERWASGLELSTHRRDIAYDRPEQINDNTHTKTGG